MCNRCFGCPTVMSDLSPAAWAPKLSKILCCLWIRSVQLTYLPDQEFTQGSKGSAYSTRPLSLQKARRFDKEGAGCQPTKSIFYPPASPTNSYFYFSCDQDSLRKMLLITVKVVFMKFHQNNNSKQLNKCV